MDFQAFVKKYGGWRPGRLNVAAVVGCTEDSHNLVAGEYQSPEGVMFQVMPPSTHGCRPHRIMVTCPSCGKRFSAGRIGQHAKARIHQEVK